MQGGLAETETSLLTHSTDLWHPDVVHDALIQRMDRRVYPLSMNSPFILPFPDKGEYYLDLP